MLILKQITLLKRILLSTLMFFLVPGSSSFAQQVIFNRVSSPEGSYFGLINDITQDLQGYMWFAIWGGGLRRYDGYHFITYMNDPMDSASLAVNTLHAVCADHNGIIWIGTEESGLDRLDTKTGIFTHFSHDQQNPKPHRTTLRHHPAGHPNRPKRQSFTRKPQQ
jgi:ligand-binding sensor domain-containing protein